MFGLSFLIYLLSLLKCQWNNYCCSVTKSCLTLCDPMDCSTQGSPILHHLLSLPSFMSIESLMPSNHLILCHPLPLLPSVFPSISLSQWVSSSHQVLKHWSFSFSISPSNEYSGWFLLGLIGLISLQSKGLSRVFSSTTIQKHQFFGAQASLWLVQFSHLYTTTGKKHSFGYMELCQQRDVFAF